jgi:hypothetical protein
VKEVMPFGRYTKAAKPTEDVIKSQIFQAVKLLSKATKTVKTFLVLKCTKKSASLRESLEKEGANAASVEARIAKEVETMESYKSLDHQVVAAAIVRMKVHFGNNPSYNTSVDAPVDDATLRTVLLQKRVQDALADVQSKIKSTVEKNNELRAKEQHTSAKQDAAKQAKSLFAKGTSVDGTKAVFMDSLDAEGEKAVRRKITPADMLKLNKSLRNQSNRMDSKVRRDREGGEADRESQGHQRAEPSGRELQQGYQREQRGGPVAGRRGIDENPSMMMYRPLDERFPSASANAAKGKPPSAEGRRPPQRAPSRAPAVPVIPKAELVRAAANGKDWQNTGVHPSWAAKQAAKKQTVGSIPSVASGGGATGKKIIFDD